MVSVAGQLDAELPGSELSITDREYERLRVKTGTPQPCRLSLMDLYKLAGEVPRWALGKYSSVAPPVPALTYITTASSAANTANYTFPAVNIGTPTADRIVVVGIAGGHNLFDTIDFVNATIQGIAATIDVSVADAQANFACIFRALVPAGTTGDIVVNFDAPAQRATIGVWTITNAGTVTVIDPGSDADNVNDVFMGIAIPNVVAGDYVIAIGKAVASTLDFAWTDITEKFDVMNEIRISGASTVSVGATTLLATLDAATPFKAMVAVAYRP